MTTLWHFSVPIGERRLHVVVPAIVRELAHERLKRDEQIWHAPEVRAHGGWVVDERRYHCQPADRLTFWVETYGR